MTVRSSKDIRGINHVTQDAYARRNVNAEKKPFTPMLQVQIATGETVIDNRQNVYWK